MARSFFWMLGVLALGIHLLALLRFKLQFFGLIGMGWIQGHGIVPRKNTEKIADDFRKKIKAVPNKAKKSLIWFKSDSWSQALETSWHGFESHYNMPNANG